MKYFWKIIWRYSKKTCSFKIAKYKGYREASRLRWECWEIQLNKYHGYRSLLWVATSYYDLWYVKPPLAPSLRTEKTPELAYSTAKAVLAVPAD